MSQVAIDNQIYSYEKLGGGKKTPLLILHGWGRSREEWLRVGEKLSDERAVYLLDLPGFGGSTLPSQIENMDKYSELVVKFCQYLKINKVIVIGHSLGGRVGILMAQPNSRVKVEKLILIDPAGIKSFSFGRIVMLGLSKIFGFVPKNVRRKLTKRLMDEDYQHAGEKEELYRVVVGKDLRKILSMIKCPTLLVWGEKDRILPLSQIKIYRARVKDLVVRVVWGAGHDPHLTRFDQLLSIVQEGVE